MKHSPTARLAPLFAIAAFGLAGCIGPRCVTHSAHTAAAREPLYATPDAAPETPVGVFDRTEVLIAYYRSEHFTKQLSGLKSQRDAALQLGDRPRARQLEREGEALQDLAHRQLLGAAPLTNIAEALADQLPQIARDSGVGQVVPRGTEPKDVATVDVTAALIQRLPPAPR